MQINQPKGIKPRTREHKLRTVVPWKGALKQKGIKQTGMKQGLGLFNSSIMIFLLKENWLEQVQNCNYIYEIYYTLINDAFI